MIIRYQDILVFKIPTENSTGIIYTEFNKWYVHKASGPGSSVGIATRYGLDGPRIVSRWAARFSAPVQTCPGATQPPYNGYQVFPGGKSGRGLTLTPHPLLVPWSWKSRAIPLLPLWPVRPVQSLTACTRVHFTFTLHKRKKWEENQSYVRRCPLFLLA
jgi:hypothetical protein